jgi:hypothetical protein
MLKYYSLYPVVIRRFGKDGKVLIKPYSVFPVGMNY